MLQGLQTDLLSVIDTAPFGFCLVGGSDYSVIYANPAFGPLIGYRGIIHNYPLASFLGPELERVLHNHPRSFEQDVVLQIEGRYERWLRVKGELMTYNGVPSYALWFIDTTAARASEEKLKKAARASEAAAEMKSNLLATMSHEIRTPMQAVFGFLELIGQESLSPQMEDMINTAKSSASGLLEILDDVLDLAKLDADKMELDMFEVPVRMLVRGTVEALSVKRHGRNVALLDEIGHGVPFVIRGDPKRLRQILINFMSNSLKFTREGSVTLRVSTQAKIVKPLQPDGIVLRFEVADTGMGMPQDVCDKLFQAFTQADNTTTRKFGGTGLGLSICKKLVSLMGGEIGVTSQEGIGSTFWFEIPTVAVSMADSNMQLPSLEGLAVLVVEDHPQGRKEIFSSLKSMGADVEACATYHEGLDLIKRRPFDVALIDHGLPDGNGLDLLTEISSLRPHTGLILYTVHDDYALQHAIHSLGATYLSKPASRIGLGEAVKSNAKQNVQTLAGPRRLLIAEDTDIVRNILEKQLHIMGHDIEVDFVSNGLEALEALKTGNYGILFTDLHMPDMDGYMLVHEIRNQEKTDPARGHLPVIALTADVQMSQRHSYLKEGFDECLLKPVSLGQMRHLLMRWGLVGEQADPVQQNNQPEQAIEAECEAINLDAMRVQMGTVDAETIEMVGMFCDLSEDLVRSIRNHYETGNFYAMGEAAHSLKGGARSACCMVLGDLAGLLQDHAQNPLKAAGLVPAIEAEFARVREQAAKLQKAIAA